MSRDAVLPENVVRPAIDHAARDDGASRGLLLMAERQFLDYVLHFVLGIERRLLRDYGQLAQSLLGHHTLHHPLRLEFQAERLGDFSRTLSPHSLDLVVWVGVVEEFKDRLIA